jgi:membrane protease YdiL (CAAX protease family)
MARKTLLLITLVVEGGLFVIGLLLIGGLDALLSRLHVSWSATAYSLLLCLPIFAMLYLGEQSQWSPLVSLRDEIDEKVVPIFANCKIIDLAVIALLAGIGEELLFRGWLQGALAARLGILPGILVASVIFGFAHYLSPTYAIYAGLTGLYLGMIYQASGNLYIVMAIHAVYDFIALVYLVKKNRGEKIELHAVG